jgi:hypothetical protein
MCTLYGLIPYVCLSWKRAGTVGHHPTHARFYPFGYGAHCNKYYYIPRRLPDLKLRGRGWVSNVYVEVCEGQSCAPRSRDTLPAV